MVPFCSGFRQLQRVSTFQRGTQLQRQLTTRTSIFRRAWSLWALIADPSPCRTCLAYRVLSKRDTPMISRPSLVDQIATNRIEIARPSLELRIPFKELVFRIRAALKRMTPKMLTGEGRVEGPEIKETIARMSKSEMRHWNDVAGITVQTCFRQLKPPRNGSPKTIETEKPLRKSTRVE